MSVKINEAYTKIVMLLLDQHNKNAAQLRMTGTQLRVYLSGKWSPDSI